MNVKQKVSLAFGKPFNLQRMKVQIACGQRTQAIEQTDELTNNKSEDMDP